MRSVFCSWLLRWHSNNVWVGRAVLKRCIWQQMIRLFGALERLYSTCTYTQNAGGMRSIGWQKCGQRPHTQTQTHTHTIIFYHDEIDGRARATMKTCYFIFCAPLHQQRDIADGQMECLWLERNSFGVHRFQFSCIVSMAQHDFNSLMVNPF